MIELGGFASAFVCRNHGEAKGRALDHVRNVVAAGGRIRNVMAFEVPDDPNAPEGRRPERYWTVVVVVGEA